MCSILFQRGLRRTSRICISSSIRSLSVWSPLAEAFNTRPAQKYNYRKQDVGLFGIPELCRHEGFRDIQEKCISNTESLIEQALSPSREKKMVEIFDEMSDTLCQVADLAEFIRLAHPKQEYARAAEEACCTVSGIVENLNTNLKLYQALKNAVTTQDIVRNSVIDKHVGELFLMDFEQSGIHLKNETDRQKVVELTNKILSYGQQFVNGTSTPKVVKKSLLPGSLRNVLGSDEDTFLVSGLYTDSPDPAAREMAFKIFLHPDPHQDLLLNKMLEARYNLANICGFPSYASRALRGSILNNPKEVMVFLTKLSDSIRDKAKADFEYMSMMKASENPMCSSKVQSWDVPYYTQKAKKEWFRVSSKEYSPYFSLGACMDGLNHLFQSLYGIQLVNSDVAAGECWSPDVYKLSVLHEREGLLGHIYCDFYERSGKPNQDCHFTIRGGRSLPDGAYQLPVVVVMLNLPAPRWSGPSLLSPNMMDNLFHEIGHAMHSMLARTEYQHVSGTRCSTDFAEVPSVLMEYFASDPRVLERFARHHRTNQPMSEEMARRLCAAKRSFTACETQLQLFYAVIDQKYHGERPLGGSTTEVLVKAQREFYGLPYVENTAWQLRFSHLVGYGAKYYSYLVSRALAHSVWKEYFERDPFDRGSGERYRAECLSHGGGKNPRDLVRDFLGVDPTPDVLASYLINEIDFNQHQVDVVMRNRA